MGVKEDCVSLYRYCTSTQERYHFAVAALILGVGLFGIEMPLVKRLEGAVQEKQTNARDAQLAASIAELMGERQVYQDRLVPTAELVDWQDYVLDALGRSGAVLSLLEPQPILVTGNFKVIELDVTATGTYSQLSDFVDRLERGPRLVRIDQISLAQSNGVLTLICRLRGLVGEADDQAASRATEENNEEFDS